MCIRDSYIYTVNFNQLACMRVQKEKLGGALWAPLIAVRKQAANKSALRFTDTDLCAFESEQQR